MKNIHEIYQALLDGKRLQNMHWSKVDYIYLDQNNKLVMRYKNSKEEEPCVNFHNPLDWKIVPEYVDFNTAIEHMLKGNSARFNGREFKFIHSMLSSRPKEGSFNPATLVKYMVEEKLWELL